jgi:hypothetical protein
MSVKVSALLRQIFEAQDRFASPQKSLVFIPRLKNKYSNDSIVSPVLSQLTLTQSEFKEKGFAAK